MRATDPVTVQASQSLWVKVDLDGNGVPDVNELGAWARAGVRVAWFLVKVFAPEHTIVKRVVSAAERQGVSP